MRGALFGGLFVVAMAVLGLPQEGNRAPATAPDPDGAAPATIWEGIQTGPGPICPAGPGDACGSPPASPSPPSHEPPDTDPFRVGPPYPR